MPGALSLGDELTEQLWRQRREFHLKLAVALALFVVFWTVGAAVFQATESESRSEGWANLARRSSS
jgi:hypothetical protein